MYTNKILRWQLLHDSFHGHACHDRLAACKVDFEVIVKAFDKNNVGKSEFVDTIIGFDKQILGRLVGFGFLEKLLVVFGFIDCLHKALERKRFQ